MNIHKNARLTPIGREHLVKAVLSGQTPEAAARAAGVCPRTARKWVARFRAEGIAGLGDRSSRPHRLHRPTPPGIVAAIIALRRQRFTGTHIARQLKVSPATVSRVLRRTGLSRMRDLEPAIPVRRYRQRRETLPPFGGRGVRSPVGSAPRRRWLRADRQQSESRRRPARSASRQVLADWRRE